MRILAGPGREIKRGGSGPVRFDLAFDKIPGPR